MYEAKQKIMHGNDVKFRILIGGGEENGILE